MIQDQNFARKTNKEKLIDKYGPKPEFLERLEKLMGKEETKKFIDISYVSAPTFIRCNTIKISPEELKKRLESNGWKIAQPFEEFPEAMLVLRESNLKPGELGKSKEHLLGHFYVQEITSMLPMFALKPQAGEFLLDLCASPGSKTTQAAAMMKNQGTIIANEPNLGRIRILTANLEKCGVTNVMVTRADGIHFCNVFEEKVKMKFNKILVDAPCSGEGTLRKSPHTFQMWNLKFIENLSRLQKRIAANALKILEVGGEMIYSTCTLSPEEDEGVVDFLKKNFDIEIEKINLPLKTREGILEWEGDKFDESVKNCCRVYPQDNDSDGFFVAKIRKLSDQCLLDKKDKYEKFREKYEEGEKFTEIEDSEELGEEDE